MPPGGPRRPNFQCGPGKVGPVRLWSGDWQCVTPCSQIRKNTLRKAKDLVERCEEEGEKKLSRLRGKRRPWRLDPNRKGPKSKGPNGNDSSSDDDDWPPYRPKTKAEAVAMGWTQAQINQEWRGRRRERRDVARNGQPARRDNVSLAQQMAQQVQGIEDAERREREQADREALAVPDEDAPDYNSDDSEPYEPNDAPADDAPADDAPADDAPDDDLDADPGTGKWEDRVEGRVYSLNNAKLTVKPLANNNDPYTIAQAQEEIVKQLPWAEAEGNNKIKCIVCGVKLNVSVDVDKGNKTGKPTWSNLNKHVNSKKHKNQIGEGQGRMKDNTQGLRDSGLTRAEAKTVFSKEERKVRGKKRATD